MDRLAKWPRGTSGPGPPRRAAGIVVFHGRHYYRLAREQLPFAREGVARAITVLPQPVLLACVGEMCNAL